MLRRLRLGGGLVLSVALTIAIAGGVSLAFSSSHVVKAGAPPFKVQICHATNSETNPYTQNDVSFNSIAKAQSVDGHGAHTGPIWAPGDKAADITWGDIIPPYDYPYETTFHYSGMNWSDLGKAFYNNGCNIPTPTATTVKTTVFDASTNTAWTDTEQEAASAYDTAVIVRPSAIPLPTGTVTYTFFTNNSCTGTGVSAGVKNLTGLAVPVSDTQSSLAAGAYSFQAKYSGDRLYAGSTSSCEPFSVLAKPAPVIPTITTACGGSVTIAGLPEGWHVVVEPGDHFFGNGTFPLGLGSYNWQLRDAQQNDQNGEGQSGSFSIVACPVYDPSTHTTTVVFDNATKAALPASLTIAPGGSVYDTSSVTHVGGGTPTGTISYRFWTNGTCSGAYTAAGTNLALGSKSSVEGPLGAGKYSFKAYFTSSNQDLFTNSESACEPLTAGGAGEVLAATAMTTPLQTLALGLIGFGLVAMMAAVAWRRRPA